MRYSTVLQVPSTQESRRLREVAKVEPKFAKTSELSPKLVEKVEYNWYDFLTIRWKDRHARERTVYLVHAPIVSLVVKNATLFIEQHALNTNLEARNALVYTLEKQAGHCQKEAPKHATLLNNFDPKSFMVKHWAREHGDMNEAPLFKLEVVKRHKDSLSRMLH